MTSLFSNNPSSGSTGAGGGTGLFANKPTQGQQPSSTSPLTGGQTSGSTGGSGLFANANKTAAPGPNTQTQSATGGAGADSGAKPGGLFGNTPTTGGTTTGGTGTQSQAPAAGGGTTTGTKPGGLLSGTTTTTTTSGGSGGLFANKPAEGGQPSSGGQTTTQPAGQTSSGGGLFTGGSSNLGGGAKAPTTTLTQPVKEEPPVYTTTYEKYLKACQSSNQYLLDLIVDPNPVLSADDFKKILNDKIVRDKLTQGFAFYKTKSGDQAFKDMKDGKLKWPGKVPITDQAQAIVKSVSDKLNLDGYQTFTLFELYFEFNKPLLDRITNPKHPNPITADELFNLERTIILQYYKERINLIECIYQIIVLGTSQTTLKYKETIDKFVAEVIKGKPAFVQGFWTAYTKASESNISEVTQRLSDLQDREEWVLQNLKEEFHILRLLCMLYYDLEECDPDFFFTMLNYFHKQSFFGSFLKHERQVTIKEILLQKQEYATMIADISILLLFNALGLPRFEEELLLTETEEDHPINAQKNPLRILLKKEKDVTGILSKNMDSIILSPLIVAWRRLIKWYSQKVKDTNVKATLKSIDIIKEDPEDYLSFLLEMKDRLLFQNANRISLCFYRNTMKTWVCLLAQNFEVESVYNYERLVDICCECLKERQNLEKFWKFEIIYKSNVAVLLFELLRMFPFREAKVVKLITTLLGNKRCNYVTNALKLFRSLDSYSCRSSDISQEDQKWIKPNPKERGTFICMNDIEVRGLTVRKDTKARIISETDRDSRVYEFEYQYNFWNVLYRRWTTLLYSITRREKVELIVSDLKLIKLVCKIIIFDNTIVDVLEEYLSAEGDMKGEMTTPISLLLIDTLASFQTLPEIPQKLIALIYKALASLQAHPLHSATLAATIQLYPRSLTVYNNPQLEMSMRKSIRSVSRVSVQGYSRAGQEIGIHPVVDIFNATKRLDKLSDGPESNYDTYIALLKFAYEIVLNNEFIFDQYPNEKYVKTFYGSNMANINKSIQRGAEIMRTILDEKGSLKSEAIKEFHNFTKNKKSQSLLYSTFIDDLFSFIYNNILDGFDKMLFVPELMDKKWKIGTLLLKITDLLLQRFLVSLDRALVISDNPPENYLLLHTISYLNNSRIADFILKTLEVVINRETLKNNKFGERFNSLGIENRLWMTYIFDQNGSEKQAKLLRDMIAQCFSCLETIVHLVEIYGENRSVTGNDPSLLHQTYVSKLNLVDRFEKLLTKKELLHSYIYNDITQSVKINIILAILSYVNFDISKGISSRVPLEPQIERLFTDPTLLRSSIVSEEEAAEIEPILAKVDPNLTKSIILKPKLKSNQQVNAVSTLAIRVLTKLAIVWEDQIPQRKPLIYEYITMISHPDKHFTSNNIIKTVIRELLCVFVNYETQPEDACALLEMMTVCLHSQNNFVDLFLKNTTNYSLYQQDSFLQFVKTFFASNVSNYKPLLSKLITFISEVFQREVKYSSFVREVRKDSSLIRSIFTAVFKTLTPNYTLAYRLSDYCNLNSQDLKASEVKELNFQLEKLIIETLVMQECSHISAIIIAVRFLIQELISSGKKSKEEEMNIALCIKEFFSGFFTIWLERFKQKGVTKLAEERIFEDFLNDLRDPDNFFNGETGLEDSRFLNRSMLQERDVSYMSNYSKTQDSNRSVISISEFKRYQRKKKRQYEQAMELEKESGAPEAKNKSDSVILKGIYKIMDINLYGYGKDFVYDTQEIYFAMRNSSYKKDFIYRSILFLNKQNLINSLIALEHKYFDSMITLFKFTSTLGLKGQAFSSTFYHFSIIPGDLYTHALEDVFEDDKQKMLANPNHKIVFPYGFPDFFTKGPQTDALDKKLTSAALFLENVIKSIWHSLKQSAKDFEVNLPSLKALEQKANFLSYSFNALFYLIKISKTLLSASSESKARKSSTGMEREKEKKPPLIFEGSGLLNTLKEIFEDLNSFVWAKVPELAQEFEVDVSPYVVLEMTFLQCFREVVDFIRFNPKEIEKYVAILELCIQGKVSCFPLIITCFELLYSLSPGDFLNYLAYSPNKLVRYLIVQVGAENVSEVESIFLIRFFVELAKDLSGALQLKDNNVIWELCSNRKLKESHQIPDYDNGKRNPYQILWCWVLILMRQMLETLHQESGFMNSAISFLKEFSPRIISTLTLPPHALARQSLDSSKLDLSTSTTSGKPFNPIKLTLAYFEELELTSSLLFEYFEHADQWVIINRTLFENILYNITHSALKLSKSVTTILESTVSITAFEKILEQTTTIDKKGADGEKKPAPREISITSSPFKGPSRKSFFGVEPPQKEHMFGSFDSYTPSVFGYKIEIAVLNTLSFLLYSTKSGLQFTELYNFFDAIDLSGVNRKKINIKYELSYWDQFALTLEDIESFLVYNLNKWAACGGAVERVAKKYDYFNNSVVSTIQNYSLNTNFQSYNFGELRDVTKTALSLVVFLMGWHHSMYKEFIGSEGGFSGGSIVGNKDKITAVYGESSNLINNKNLFSNANIGWESAESKLNPDLNDLFLILREQLK